MSLLLRKFMISLILIGCVVIIKLMGKPNCTNAFKFMLNGLT